MASIRRSTAVLAFGLLGACSGEFGSGGSYSSTDPGASGNNSSGGGGTSLPAPFDPARSAATGGSGSIGQGGAPANTNVSLSGAQDFGAFRARLVAGQVPQLGDFDAPGFFAEHHINLPPPTCGKRICLQAMLAVMGNLSNGRNDTMVQLGLNSPIAADPGQRPPLTLAVVVDVSGSMAAANKIDFVRDGLDKLVDGLRDGDRVSLISYSSNVNVLFPMQEVALKRVELHALARGLVADGSTNFHAGLEAGFKQVMANYDSGRQNRVIMISDGEPTVGVTDSPTIIAMSRSYNSEGVGLTTIGLGFDFNASLMRSLAQQADGNFYFLENAGAVSEVFTQELSFFTVPVAFDLKLKLLAGSEYQFSRAYGSPFWKDDVGKTGGTLSVPSVFLAHRTSAADQTPDGGRRGGGSALLIEMSPTLVADDGRGLASADVATLDVSFREPGTNQIVSDRVVVNYPDAPWVTREKGVFVSPDMPAVQKSFVMLNMYGAIENAVRMFYAGQAGSGEPVGSLRRLVAAVEDYNQEIGDADITSDLAMIKEFIAVLVRNGARDPGMANIPADPWPAD